MYLWYSLGSGKKTVTRDEHWEGTIKTSRYAVKYFFRRMFAEGSTVEIEVI